MTTQPKILHYYAQKPTKSIKNEREAIFSGKNYVAILSQTLKSFRPSYATISHQDN